jgi:hypothetical protein
MVRATITTRAMTGKSRNAARVAFAAGAMFIVLLAALHVLEPEFDPSWRFISEYELGEYGWMMRLAFLALASSCAALCVAILSQIRTVGGYLGLAMVALSASGMVLAAVFVTDPVTIVGAVPTTRGRLHELGAMLDGVPVAALLISSSLARNRAWIPARRTLLWTAGLPLLGLVVFIASLALMLPPPGQAFGPEVLVGWPNRILILAHCAWLMPVAWLAVTLSPAPLVDHAGNAAVPSPG